MKLSTFAYSIAATLLAASAGCGDVNSTGPEPDPEDIEAPLVVATTPTTSGTGVDAKAKITITFSEPMDPETVMSAYESTMLPLDKVSTSWNADQTELTISPDAGLAYAEGIGTDLTAVTRLAYSISIGPGAADLIGNPMGAAFVLSFSTKVRMATTAPRMSALSRSTLGGATLAENMNLFMGDSYLANMAYRGYVTFDLAALPQGSVIESAAFSARQLGITGTPYQSLGALKTFHLTFSTMENVNSVASFSEAPVFSMDGDAGSKSIDVSAQVADDLVNRATRGDDTQYRLQFDTVSANNEYDYAEFSKDTFEMSLVYIAD